MKRYLSVLCCLLYTELALGQVLLPNKDQPIGLSQSVFGLGLSAGYLSGFGLSFRHHLPSVISYQIVAGIIKTDAKSNYNLGGQIQYDLVRGEGTRFYGCGGMGYFYSGESGHNDLEGPFRIGLGIGAVGGRMESFSISGELNFTYFSDGSILPLPQLSAHYYFY